MGCYLVSGHIYTGSYLVSGHIYMGCYLEVDYPPDMTITLSNTQFLLNTQPGFDTVRCISECYLSGYTYSAVYSGIHCKCDVALGRYGLQPDDRCQQCEGRIDQMCYDVMAVYSTGETLIKTVLEIKQCQCLNSMDR